MLQGRNREASQALAPEPVQVWVLPVSGAVIEESRLEAKLRSEELLRANRFRRPDDRARYVVAHAGLRSILTDVFGVDPPLQRLVRGAGGKPRLTPLAGLPAVRFNLSHSGSMVLIAASCEAEVGVDVEWKDRTVELGVLETFCSSEELAWLATLPTAARIQGLYRLWTLKEALSKAHGSGMRSSWREISIGLSHETTPHVLSDGSGPWFVKELRVSGDYAAAVAFSGRPKSVVQFSAEFRGGELKIAEVDLA